jgi:hypothetical protein
MDSLKAEHDKANPSEQYFIRKKYLSRYSTFVVDAFRHYIRFIMNECYGEFGCEVWCGRLELSQEGLIHLHALFKIKNDIVSDMYNDPDNDKKIQEYITILNNMCSAYSNF